MTMLDSGRRSLGNDHVESIVIHFRGARSNFGDDPFRLKTIDHAHISIFLLSFSTAAMRVTLIHYCKLFASVHIVICIQPINRRHPHYWLLGGRSILITKARYDDRQREDNYGLKCNDTRAFKKYMSSPVHDFVEGSQCHEFALDQDMMLGSARCVLTSTSSLPFSQQLYNPLH